MPTVTPKKLQGYLGQLQYGATPADVLGLKEVEIEIKSDKIDATDHSTAGWKSSMNGLLSWTATAKLDYITGDASQQALRTALLNSTGLPIVFLPTVSTGSGIDSYSGTAIVTSFKTSAKNSDLQPVDIQLEGVGALTIGAQ